MTSTLTRMDAAHHDAVRALLVSEATRGPARTVPRPRRSAPWLTVGLGGVAAVTVAAVLLAGDPAAPASMASWTAVPDSPTSTAEAAQAAQEQQAEADRLAAELSAAEQAEAAVQDQVVVQDSPCRDLTGAAVGIQGVPEQTDAAAAREPLVDRRGDWVYCVDVARGSGTATDPLVVLGGLRDGDGFVAATSTVWDRAFTWPNGTDVRVLGGDPDGAATGEDARGTLIGALGPEVLGVDVLLTDGTRITTTVQDGVWAAWWPGSASTSAVDRLVVRTLDGDEVEVDPTAVGLPWDEGA